MSSHRRNLLKNDVLLNIQKDSLIRKAVGSFQSSILLEPKTHNN